MGLRTLWRSRTDAKLVLAKEGAGNRKRGMGKKKSSQAIHPQALSTAISAKELKNINSKTIKFFGVSDRALENIQNQIKATADLHFLEATDNDKLKNTSVKSVCSTVVLGRKNRRWFRLLEEIFNECQRDLSFAFPDTEVDITLDDVLDMAERNQVQLKNLRDFVRGRMFECVKLSHFYR